MISKLSKPVISSVFKSQRNYYRILKDVQVGGEAIPLYTASRFDALNQVDGTKSFVNAVYSNKAIHERYLKLVPFFLEAVTGFHRKHYVTKLGLVEKGEALRFTCLAPGGVVTKHVALSNLIPVIFDDFLHANRRKMFEMPEFLDHEMIYYSLFDDTFYLFDKEGQWHQEGVSHPLLDINKRFDERKFYDTLRIL